jgi:hypothetical protein
MLTGEPGDVTAYRSRRVTPDRRLRGQSMTNYARMYRFGITPWEGYRTVAAARISALRDREETERSRPSRPCARPRLRSRSVHPRARAEGVGGRRHRLCAGRVRGGGSKEPERGRAQLRRRRRDAAAVGPAGDVRLFLDIGCFQGLDAEQRLSQGGGVCALANPGATLLLLSFGPSRWQLLVGGASQEGSRPPSGAGRCSRSSRRTPRAWAGR